MLSHTKGPQHTACTLSISTRDILLPTCKSAVISHIDESLTNLTFAGVCCNAQCVEPRPKSDPVYAIGGAYLQVTGSHWKAVTEPS